MEEGQHYFRMDPFDYLCQMIMVFLEERVAKLP